MQNFMVLFCAFGFAGCTAWHGRMDPQTQAPIANDGATSGIVPHDAGIVRDVGSQTPVQTCTADYPNSAFVPDDLFAIPTLTRARAFLLPGVTGYSCRSTPVPPVWRPGIAGYAWDGQRCRSVHAEACVTLDACARAQTLAQCRSSHTGCVPEQCRNSGGQWSEIPLTCSPVWYEGMPPEDDCLAEPQVPTCVCPLGQTFSFERGACAVHPTAEPRDPHDVGCWASGGILGAACDYTCGQGGPCDDTHETCDCGPGRQFNYDRFETVLGCDRTPSHICTATRGRWRVTSQESPYCQANADIICGQLVPQLISSPVCQVGVAGLCDCGPLGRFDSELGCVFAPGCRTHCAP